ncbi:MAG: hypothetical protein ACXABY_04105 [Candidatus Thorarchaeota archaeon]|jgi:hypothetical protein
MAGLFSQLWKGAQRVGDVLTPDTPEGQRAMMMAGLGTLASAGKDPLAGGLGNVGAGGLLGMQAYENMMQQNKENQMREQLLGLKEKTLQMEMAEAMRPKSPTDYELFKQNPDEYAKYKMAGAGINEQMYMNEKGEYRWGLYDRGGNMVRDLRPATEKDIKGKALVEIDMGKHPAATQLDAMIETQQGMDSLYRIKDLFDAHFVGPYAGRKGAVGDIFGFNPQKQSEFYAAEQQLKNAMIKAITGAQMSEPEAKRIMRQLPDKENPPTVWNARWNQSLINFREVQKRRTEVLRKTGFRTPELEPSGPEGGGLRPGKIEGGYRFRGGNPADENNWEKVQ